MDQVTQEEFLKQAMKDHGILLAYAYGLLRDWALAQDVVQDSIVVVSTKWQTFRHGTSVRAWARGIVRLKAYEAIRKRKREAPVEEDVLMKIVDERMDAYCDRIQPDELNRRTQALTECLGRLNEQSRSIITKFYWNKRSCEQLSILVGKTNNALRLQLSRLRQKLRLCVERRLSVEQA